MFTYSNWRKYKHIKDMLKHVRSTYTHTYIDEKNNDTMLELFARIC